MRLVSNIIVAIVALIIGIGGTLFYSQSQTAGSAVNVAAAKKLITTITDNKAVILKNFMVDNGKLQGFVVKGTGKNTPEGILFTDASGSYVISGTILNAKKVNFAKLAYSKYITPARAAKAYKDISTVAYVTDGKNSAPHKLYVMADPNCVFCHRFYEETRTLVNDGQLQIRWIMGGLLKPSSKGKTATILSAKDPAAALALNEKTFNEKIEEGAAKPMENIPAALAAKIKANATFMIKNNFLQTPTLLFKNNKGTAKIFTGMPQKKQLKALINSMSAKF